jgi:NADH:ubiquinone reductase (H+-translocating)
MRIVVLGGGFAGVTTVRHLERVLRRRKDVEITLVSRENFFMLTPLLFEACSGRLELRHCAQPIRAALRRARFIEATVQSVDLERQLVRAEAPEDGESALPYDHLVVALGASTNDRLIPGSSNALTFKTMADALVLRNHLIECFERADAAADAAQRRGCLTIVVCAAPERDYRCRHHRTDRRHRPERRREHHPCRPRSAWPDRGGRHDAKPQPSPGVGTR